MSVNRIKMAPTATKSTTATKSPTSKDYYLTRAWGESSIPFTVIYSNYARSKLQQKLTSTTTTTVSPTQQIRRKNGTKKPSQLHTLFVSNGWGPIG